MTSRKMTAALLGLALLALPSCGNRSIFIPPGSYSNIVLVTESGEPGGLNDHIIRALQHPIDYYSKLEIQFRLRMISSFDFEREPPTKNMVKPAGQWNRYIITLIDHSLKVELNGEQIIDLDLSTSKVKDRPLKGYISFQDEAKPVWYRNVRIKELK